ncbi:MAG: class I SAM-dependent methyltransferase [Chloroflexota bacterium]
MREINMLARYPVSKGRNQLRPQVLEADRQIAKQFGQAYFDGPRTQGYGGYNYHERFWTGVAEDLRDAYGIKAGTKVLDVGCGKGFLLHDLKRVAPGVEVAGLDISAYAIEHAMEDVKPYLKQGTAASLPFEDGSFDVVLSINTLHNLPLDACKQAIRELERVKKPGGHGYLQVDSWFTEEQHQAFEAWQLTALTYFDRETWIKLFEECGYTGDYYWTVTE